METGNDSKPKLEGAEPPAPAAPEELPSDTWHQIRQILAGFLALGAGLFDEWVEGSSHGFDTSFDTVLVLTGLYLISGVRGVMVNKK